MANYVILGKTYNNVEGIKATDDNGNEVVYETSENSTLSQLINNTLTSYSSTNATSLRDTLFAGKTALTTVNTPNVTSVGNSCFNGCSNLSSLTTGALTSIGSSSFVECSQLTSVNLASSLTMIPGYAFRNTGITSIPNQSTLTQIGDSSFSGCNGLTQITLSSTLTRVGNYAFQDCSNLSKVYFNCTSITGFSEYNCFRGCSSLLKVDTVDGANTLVVPTSMTQIPGWFIRGNNTITTVDVSNTQATSIGESAFNDIIATQIALPSTLTTIGNFAFRDARNLLSLTIPSLVTAIPDYMCDRCYSLQSAVIQGSVTSVGQQAFNGCSNCLLYDFRNNAVVPTLASTNAFGSINANAKIVVPDALYADWIVSSGWSTFASYIVKASDYTP